MIFNPVTVIALCLALGLAAVVIKERQNAPAKPDVAFRRSLSHELMQAQTVRVKTAHGQGSGFTIVRGDRVFVWTAKHVVRDIEDVEVHSQLRYRGVKAGEVVYSAHVIARLPCDAALLWADIAPDKVAPTQWSSSSASPGIPVFSVGNVRGTNFDGTISAGIVSQVGVSPGAFDDNPPFPWKVADQATIIAIPGVSGGPIFDDAGLALGIVVGTANLNGNISIYVPVREIYWSAADGQVSWAVYGTSCPPEKVLREMVVACTPAAKPPELDFLQLLIGPQGVPAAPSKSKTLKSPKSR